MDRQIVKPVILITVIVAASAILFFAALNKTAVDNTMNNPADTQARLGNDLPDTKADPESDQAAEGTLAGLPQIISPLNDPEDRIRLKHFGDHITPETSPVSPERFRGYHTGVDFEVFPEELNSAVEIKAACIGKVLEKRWVSGYGGVVVMECEIDNEAVAVLYGHLNIASADAGIGDFLSAGTVIGSLGADNSQETDYERKHLHFSIHKGGPVNLKGYVPTEAELAAWLDPCDFFCKQ